MGYHPNVKKAIAIFLAITYIDYSNSLYIIVSRGVLLRLLRTQRAILLHGNLYNKGVILDFLDH